MKRKWRHAAGRLWNDIWNYKWVGVCIVVYYLLVEAIFSAFCPLVIMTGFPCPGCGMTRAFLCVFTGQFVRAWNLNPLVYGWILFALYAGVQRYIRNQKIKGWKYLLTILAAAMIIVYIYRMYQYFPDRAPMAFTGGSMFERLLPGYGRIIRKLIY